MQFAVGAILALVGVIHLLPAVGVLGAPHLQRLYGLHLTDPNLVLLMRHRAFLFGLLGAFMLYTVMRPALHSLGLAMGLLSVSAFVVLAASQLARCHPAIRGVFFVDIAAAVLLLAAVGVHALRSP